jgi:hypothetical protein
MTGQVERGPRLPRIGPYRFRRVIDAASGIKKIGRHQDVDVPEGIVYSLD